MEARQAVGAVLPAGVAGYSIGAIFVARFRSTSAISAKTRPQALPSIGCTSRRRVRRAGTRGSADSQGAIVIDAPCFSSEWSTAAADPPFVFSCFWTASGYLEKMRGLCRWPSAWGIQSMDDVARISRPARNCCGTPLENWKQGIFC